MEKIIHPMGEALKEIAYLNKKIRIHPILDITIDFCAGGLVCNEFLMALEISKRYDTTVKFELYEKTLYVYPNTDIELLYKFFRSNPEQKELGRK